MFSGTEDNFVRCFASFKSTESSSLSEFRVQNDTLLKLASLKSPTKSV